MKKEYTMQERWNDDAESPFQMIDSNGEGKSGLEMLEEIGIDVTSNMDSTVEWEK